MNRRGLGGGGSHVSPDLRPAATAKAICRFSNSGCENDEMRYLPLLRKNNRGRTGFDCWFEARVACRRSLWSPLSTQAKQ